MNSLLDIPTSMTEPEAVALQQLAQDKRVLEVGALLGFSTVILAQVAEHVTSIDPHEGYPFDNPRDTWLEFNGNLEQYGVDDKVEAIKATDEILLTLDTALELPAFDLAFLDLDGTYPTTFRVMERAVEYLHPEGLLCVHDYNLPNWPGAGEAIRDYCTQTGTYFGVIDTLAIIRLGHPDD